MSLPYNEPLTVRSANRAETHAEYAPGKQRSPSGPTKTGHFTLPWEEVCWEPCGSLRKITSTLLRISRNLRRWSSDALLPASNEGYFRLGELRAYTSIGGAMEAHTFTCGCCPGHSG
jgi:hypothetical protein